MKLKTRIIALVSAALAGLLLLSGIALYQLREQLMEERRAQLTTLVELAHASLGKIHEREKAGEFSREDAQKLARETIGSFHKDDRYFWARNYTTDVNQIHPNPKRVGIMDKDGKAKGDEYRKAMAGKSIGFLINQGTRPGAEGTFPKLYAVMKFDPWDWIVGYGIFVDDINQKFWEGVQIFLAICTLILAGVGTLAYRMSRNILGQLGGEPQYASQLAMQVASGDLSQHIETSGRGDNLLTSMQRMQEGLRTLVGRFRSASNQLSTAAADLSRHMGEVSEGARQTSESTASTAAAVEQMTVSIDSISTSARETETNSQQAFDLANRGEGLVTEAAGEIQNIASEMEEAATVVRSLVARSREIDSMSAVIREIAEQTNLLALNAAIEAARAGEQGRGFAVVADEVRKLAERTAVATKDITQTIHAIQRDTDTAATRMDGVRTLVERGVTLSEQAAEALREISGGAQVTLEKTREVALASKEQSQASNSIAGNIERIAQMVDASDAAVRAALAQVRELDQLASELHDSAASFKLES